MALMDAKEYDPRPAQKRRRIIVTTAVIVLAVSAYLYFTRYNSEKNVIDSFFHAIEQKDYDAAYGIYNADANWKQHSEKYPAYTINQFKLDWGPSSEYGAITSHHVDCAIEPPKKGFVSPSGVIVVVIINNLHETKSLWVEKKSKTITDSPMKVLCHGQE